VLASCVKREEDLQFILAARTDVPALIARVRELEAECERTRIFGSRKFAELRAADVEQMRAYGLSYEGVRKVLREHDDGEISFGKLMDLLRAAARAMAEPASTYSEGETLLRAQAAEAQQLAKQMMDERDEAKAHVVCLEALLHEQTEECDELDEERREAWQHLQNNMSHVFLKGAHGALADAGDVEVPPLTEPIDETIRAIVRERNKLRAECTTLRREIAALMDDH